jgi:hypothetical protein
MELRHYKRNATAAQKARRKKKRAMGLITHRTRKAFADLG